MLLSLWSAYSPWGDKVEVEIGGGIFNDHQSYYKTLQQQKDAELELKAKEERIIRLQQEAQDLRLRQIELEKLKEKQSARQLAALNDEISRILELIAQEIRFRQILERKLFDLRNDEAILVISMSMPFLNLGAKPVYMH